MNRVTAGDDISLTFNVGATGETYTARFVDARNMFLDATTTVNGASVTVSVNNDQWSDGESGIGRVEITKDDGGIKTVVKSERVRIMPGLDADFIGSQSDYGR